MSKPRRSEGEPHDRLTKLCDEMTDVIAEKGKEAADVKGVLMLQDGEKGGLVMYGYDDDKEAMVDLIIHLTVIFEANGKKLVMAPLRGNPGDN